MFAEDLRSEFGGNYTLVDCLLKCRIRSIGALCSCIPFQLPTNFVGVNSDDICTLQHIPCLNKYRSEYTYWSLEK
jgi:hypothetical protein